MTETNEHWDATTEKLVAFTEQADYSTLDADVVHETKRRLIDTFASALGACDEPPAKMARAIAKRSRGDVEASIWGSDIRTTPDVAAFTNGTMTRLLDISDTYLGISRGHPSDMNAGLVALAESGRRDGKSLLNAIVLAYDIYCSFCDAVDVNSKGWDQPMYDVMGCVLGAAKLLRLTREQTGHALSLALTPNLGLGQARRGNLSIWKGCAGPNASRNAVFAAILAQEGFTGPTAVFEGNGGLWQVLGGAFDWPLPQGRHMISETHTKSLPICYHAQSSTLAALELRGSFDVRNIEEVQIDGYRAAVSMCGAEPSRWAPDTRETADHSLPDRVSVGLLEGRVDNDSFTDAKLRDATIGSLMRKVKVREDAGLNAQYPDGAPGRVSVLMSSGEKHTKEIRYPTGHYRAPMSDAELEAKFRDLSRTCLNAAQADAALSALWKIDSAPDVGAVIGLMTRR